MTAPVPVRALHGVRVLELGSLAPAPFCSMILADFGADVVLVERPGGTRGGIEAGWPPLFSRGKRAVTVDLKTPDGLEFVRQLAAKADVFIEGFRPGVTEGLGLAPATLMAANPRLIYARVSGWGQEGPYAKKSGHDINYISIAGVLAQIGVSEPVPPGPFVGDFGGGSLMAVIGILLALQARTLTGRGQIVDAAIVDGVTLLMEGVFELHRRGHYHPRGLNMLDGHAPFYGAYECADGGWFSVGAIEPHFYSRFLETLGITDEPPGLQLDRTRWAPLRARVAAIFRGRSRAEWESRFSVVDTCTAPVLNIEELAGHPHLLARHRIQSLEHGWSASPAPKLSQTPGVAGETPQHPCTDLQQFLTETGWT